MPHGVRQVKGNVDMTKARIVIHGWFTEPQPFFSGGLSEDDATEALNEALEAVYPKLDEVGRVFGVLTVRIHVSSSDGKVKSVTSLTDTLVPDPNDVNVDAEGFEEDVR